MTIKESDWKKFKKVRERALQRFSQRILDECQAIIDDDAKTPHERYLDLYRLTRKRDEEIANAFNDFSRSKADMCLRLMRFHELVTDEEISEFSLEFQGLTNPDWW